MRGRCDPETDRCDLLTVWPLVGRRPVFDGYPLDCLAGDWETSVDIAATEALPSSYHRWFFMASTEFSTSRRFGPNACFSMLLVISCRMRFQLIDIHPRRLQLIAKAMTLPPVLRDGKLRQMLCNTDQRPGHIAAPTLYWADKPPPPKWPARGPDRSTPMTERRTHTEPGLPTAFS